MLKHHRHQGLPKDEKSWISSQAWVPHDMIHEDCAGATGPHPSPLPGVGGDFCGPFGEDFGAIGGPLLRIFRAKDAFDRAPAALLTGCTLALSLLEDLEALRGELLVLLMERLVVR